MEWKEERGGNETRTGRKTGVVMSSSETHTGRGLRVVHDVRALERVGTGDGEGTVQRTT